MWCRLSARVRVRVCRCACVSVYVAGGLDVFVVAEGSVRVSVRRPHGKPAELVLGLLGPGQWFGGKPVLTGACFLLRCGRWGVGVGVGEGVEVEVLTASPSPPLSCRRWTLSLGVCPVCLCTHSSGHSPLSLCAGMPNDFSFIADTTVQLLHIPLRAFFPLAAECSGRMVRALVQQQQHRTHRLLQMLGSGGVTPLLSSAAPHIVDGTGELDRAGTAFMTTLATQRSLAQGDLPCVARPANAGTAPPWHGTSHHKQATPCIFTQAAQACSGVAVRCRRRGVRVSLVILGFYLGFFPDCRVSRHDAEVVGVGVTRGGFSHGGHGEGDDGGDVDTTQHVCTCVVQSLAVRATVVAWRP